MNELDVAIDTKILLAIERLQTALKYGRDMRSSKISCVNDSIDLLTDIEFILKDIELLAVKRW